MSTVTINITENSLEILKALAESENLSPSELVEKAIATYAKVADAPSEARTLQHDEAFQAAFGLWADRGEDGLAYQERLRSEWPD